MATSSFLTKVKANGVLLRKNEKTILKQYQVGGLVVRISKYLCSMSHSHSIPTSIGVDFSVLYQSNCIQNVLIQLACFKIHNSLHDTKMCKSMA